MTMCLRRMCRLVRGRNRACSKNRKPKLVNGILLHSPGGGMPHMPDLLYLQPSLSYTALHSVHLACICFDPCHHCLTDDLESSCALKPSNVNATLGHIDARHFRLLLLHVLQCSSWLGSGVELPKQTTQQEEFVDAPESLLAPPQPGELSNGKVKSGGAEDNESVEVEEPAAVKHAEPSANGNSKSSSSNSKSSTISALSSPTFTSPSEE